MTDLELLRLVRESAKEEFAMLERAARIIDMAHDYDQLPENVSIYNMVDRIANFELSDFARKFLYHMTEQMFSIAMNKYNIRRANSN